MLSTTQSTTFFRNQSATATTTATTTTAATTTIATATTTTTTTTTTEEDRAFRLPGTEFWSHALHEGPLRGGGGPSNNLSTRSPRLSTSRCGLLVPNMFLGTPPGPEPPSPLGEGETLASEGFVV